MPGAGGVAGGGWGDGGDADASPHLVARVEGRVGGRRALADLRERHVVDAQVRAVLVVRARPARRGGRGRRPAGRSGRRSARSAPSRSKRTNVLAGTVSTPDGTIRRPRRSLAVLTPATSARTQPSTVRPPPEEVPMVTAETPRRRTSSATGGKTVGAPASRCSRWWLASRSRPLVITALSWVPVSSPVGPRPSTSTPRGVSSSTGVRSRYSPMLRGYWLRRLSRVSRPPSRSSSRAFGAAERRAGEVADHEDVGRVLEAGVADPDLEGRRGAVRPAHVLRRPAPARPPPASRPRPPPRWRRRRRQWCRLRRRQPPRRARASARAGSGVGVRPGRPAARAPAWPAGRVRVSAWPPPPVPVRVRVRARARAAGAAAGLGGGRGRRR